MQHPGLELKQVNLRGRHLLGDAAQQQQQQQQQRWSLTAWLRARALRRIKTDIELMVHAAGSAFSKGDMEAFRMFASRARELAAHRDEIHAGTAVPIDATDMWRAVIVLAVLLWGGSFLYLFFTH